jgi:hypothetical protein
VSVLARVSVAAAAVLLSSAIDAAVANQSVYTLLRRSDCRLPPADIAASFAARHLGVQSCPALPGWQLLVVASDTNTWIEVRSATLTWSSESAIVYDAPFGFFPTVHTSSPVEWRKRPDGRLVALIFRVSAQPDSASTERIHRLFVVRLESDRACLLGKVTTNTAARRLADSAAHCESR